jgi:hypothetical protein
MKRWNLPIAIYLFVVFLSGAVVGALGYRLYSPPAAKSGSVAMPPKITPEEFRRQYLEEMRTRVNLTPDQMQKLNVILDESRAHMLEARGQHDQTVKQIREQQFEQVRAMLTPEQLPKYEQVRLEREQRAKAAGKKR